MTTAESVEAMREAKRVYDAHLKTIKPLREMIEDARRRRLGL
jgi:hypothetical protein